MGSHRIEPGQVTVEFLFGAENPTVVTFSVPTPERVVFLPVPDWVVETIWQGHVDGSYHFSLTRGVWWMRLSPNLSRS